LPWFFFFPEKAEMLSHEEVEIGMILYLISKCDDPGPLPNLKVSDAEAGWMFLRSIAGETEEISFEVFEEQTRRVVTRGILELGVKEKIVSYLQKVLGKYAASNKNILALPMEITEKIISWLAKFPLLLSSAFFCLFGANPASELF
jgi:hypothetical protein